VLGVGAGTPFRLELLLLVEQAAGDILVRRTELRAQARLGAAPPLLRDRDPARRLGGVEAGRRDRVGGRRRRRWSGLGRPRGERDLVVVLRARERGSRVDAGGVEHCRAGRERLVRR
jgi:hypothetical protein